MELHDIDYAVKAGDLDMHLADVQDLVRRRLTEIRTLRRTDAYGIGDRVRFNDFCGTQHLHGMTAVVTGKTKRTLVVQLDRPVRKFTEYVNGVARGGATTVPPSIVDLVG